MILPKYKNEHEKVGTYKIYDEIICLHKKLLDLRIARSMNQKFSSHLFKHYRNKIAQLKFKAANKKVPK
uniref:Ribosomal protein L29 n=1 Tax=Pedospumella sp. Jangsampo120217C5 TaxID=2782409 RepID=A0A7S6PV10_9STRA|nr:ribosomal protein L29 [Pedospumella sp. Jangsampo120217C5]